MQGRLKIQLFERTVLSFVSLLNVYSGPTGSGTVRIVPGDIRLQATRDRWEKDEFSVRRENL